ncbi:hypothetical protein ACFFK0_16095 [Paenibacillus chartarius]|uniref:Uncharacterized protein n=1 Tax=Paenibacillus chartarius TaxID=747481 RepID=A0ABV6DMS6_9BACL
MNPPRQIRQYFQDDDNSRSALSMVRFVTGRILFDREGTVREMKAEARRIRP